MTGAGQGSWDPVRLLQAGLGGWGRDWAQRILRQVEGIVPVAWVEPSATARRLAQAEAGVPGERCFGSLAEALAAGERPLDAVLVTTDLPHHAETVRMALEAGLHVLVEKPFAASVAEARPLVKLAEQRGRVLMVSQNYRFHAVVRRVAELVREGDLGRVDEVGIDFRRLSEPHNGVLGRHHLEEQPLLVDMSIHHFDLLRLILADEPRRVDCRTWRPPWSPFNGPPVGTAIIEFGGGPVVSYRGSWLSRGEPTPWSGEWRMQCERGEIRWAGRGNQGTRVDRLVLRRRHDGRGGVDEEVPLEPVRYQDRAGALHEFASAIRQERAPETSGRDNLGTLALMEAAVASSLRAAPVEIRPPGAPAAGRRAE